MADIYLAFGDAYRPVHHTRSVRSNVNFDYYTSTYPGGKPSGDKPSLVGIEVLGVDYLSVDGRDLRHLLDKEQLAAKLQQIGESLGLFPYVPGKQLYCQDAMLFAERLLGE